MGLDMYLQGRKTMFNTSDAVAKTEDGFKIEGFTLDIGYWRKHPNLHGYIVKTFAEGKDQCQDIDLDVAALRKIVEAVKAKTLPDTTGFFFGNSTWYDDLEAEVIAPFEKAIAWLEAPKVKSEWSREVFYRASW